MKHDIIHLSLKKFAGDVTCKHKTQYHIADARSLHWTDQDGSVNNRTDALQRTFTYEHALSSSSSSS